MATLAAPRATLGPAVARIFSANFRHTKGARAGQPFHLEPWQRDDIDLMYELDDRGRRMWRYILYGIARGNGKSPTAAGIGLVELLTRTDSPDVFCAAASRDQASIVHGFASSFVEGGPLRDYMRPLRRAITYDRVKGSLRTLSADGYLAHGLSLSAGIRDEVHAWTTDKQHELYWALETASHKRPDSVLIDISTAGFDKATLLGERYDACMREMDVEWSDDGCLAVGRNRDAHMLMIWRGAPDNADPGDRAVWRAVNPASWIDLDDLERQARSIPANVFRRLHLNQWTESEDAAFRAEDWDACCDQTVVIPDGAEVALGVDIGERRDSSAVAVAWADEGRVVVDVKIFPPRDDSRSLLPDVEAHIRALADRFDVMEVAHDPWQFRRSAELLSADGLVMVEFPQNDVHMVPASQCLHDLVQQRRVVHGGDRLLRRHVLSVEARQTSRGTWRMAKPLNQHGRRTDEARKVDGAIAMVMAVARAARYREFQFISEVWN